MISSDRYMAIDLSTYNDKAVSGFAFLVLDWGGGGGGKADPGIGLSYRPPVYVAWRGGPVRQPLQESTISPVRVKEFGRSSSSIISYSSVQYMYTLKLGAAQRPYIYID